MRVVPICLFISILPVYAPNANPRPGENVLPFQTARNGARLHCVDGSCLSLETPIHTNIAPADQPTLEGFESIREQSRDYDRRRAKAEALVAELQDSRAPETHVPLTVELTEEPFDYSMLRGMRGEERADVLAARRAQLEPVQHAFLERIEELGGRAIGVSGLTNQVDLSFPAGRLEELLAMEDVVGISRADLPGGNSHANGWTIRSTAFGQTVPDHDGSEGNRWDGAEIRVAIIEFDTPLNIGHRAWRDWSGPNAPSRLFDTRHCKWQYYFPFGGYECVSGASGSLQGHGTSVTGVLLGSIEQGQDPNFPGNFTAQQIQRSGIAREAEFHYYMASDAYALRAAIEHAVSYRADVINMSMHVSNDACSGTADAGGVRGAIMAAENAGVVMVAAAGNDQNGQPCSDGNPCAINFPATLTDVMAVGGVLQSGPGYHQNGFWRSSECGRVQTPIAGGAVRWAPMIDLVSHSSITNFPGSGTIGYFTYNIFGTSFSTPIVSGAAALTRNWMHELGWQDFDSAYAVRANLLVMGDASWQVTGGDPNSAGSPVTREYSDINWGFGYGRLKYRWPDPDTSQLGSQGSWGYNSFTMTSGQTVSFSLGDGNPLSQWVLGWKLAVIADENSYGEMPDLDVRIVDTCLPGSPTLQSAVRLAGRWRIVLDQNTHFLTGRCLEARITATATSGPVEVHVADYGFSNSYSVHLF